MVFRLDIVYVILMRIVLIFLAAMCVAGCEDGLGSSLSRHSYDRLGSRTTEVSHSRPPPDMPRSRRMVRPVDSATPPRASSTYVPPVGSRE